MRVELQIELTWMDFGQRWNIIFVIKKALKKCLDMKRSVKNYFHLQESVIEADNENAETKRQNWYVPRNLSRNLIE